MTENSLFIHRIFNCCKTGEKKLLKLQESKKCEIFVYFFSAKKKSFCFQRNVYNVMN